MGWTHVVAALASVAAGAFFLRIGLVLRRRAPEMAAPRHAVSAFSVWWLAIGLNTWAYAGLVLAGAAGSVQSAMLARSAGFVLAGAAMWGLLTYLAFIYRGRDVSRPLGWAYAALVAATVAYFWWAGPDELVVRDWSVDVPATPTNATATVNVVLTLAFLLPPVLAGPFFLRLLARTSDPAQRRRIKAVGLGIPAWALLHLVARLSDADAWQLLTRVVVGVAVAVAVSVAYGRGPRMGGRGADGGSAAPTGGLLERLEQLV